MLLLQLGGTPLWNIRVLKGRAVGTPVASRLAGFGVCHVFSHFRSVQSITSSGGALGASGLHLRYSCHRANRRATQDALCTGSRRVARRGKVRQFAPGRCSLLAWPILSLRLGMTSAYSSFLGPAIFGNIAHASDWRSCCIYSRRDGCVQTLACSQNCNESQMAADPSRLRSE